MLQNKQKHIHEIHKFRNKTTNRNTFSTQTIIRILPYQSTYNKLLKKSYNYDCYITTIERLAEEAYANKSIFSVDLADYANLKLCTDYLKAAKLETPSLTHECFDTIAQLIQEMGTDGMEELILHITCNGDHPSETTSDGINLMARLTQEFIPNTCVLYGVSAKDSTESSFTILLLAGYLQK